MRVFQIEDSWGIEHLRLSQRPTPTPGAGHILVQMQAGSLNYRDLFVLERGYGRYTGTLPLIPVSDGVGIVIDVGPDVHRVAIGDRVCPSYFPHWISGAPDIDQITQSLGGPMDGVMADIMCLPEHGVVKVPEHLTDVEAATLPCAALTAWRALTIGDGIKPGDRVLIQGCGGVALFAVQFARLLGAHITVITSSEERMARVQQWGADATINYRATPEWSQATQAITMGRGYDLIVELGGEKTFPQSLRCMKPAGTIAMIGVLSGNALTAALGPIVTRHIRLQGITVGHRTAFEAMMRAIDQHKLRPVIDRVFAFEELIAALNYLKSGQQFGKIGIAH